MKPLLYLALLATFNARLLAQDTTAVNEIAASRAPLYRDPHKARILGSVFPGAGHIYAGEYLRGYGYYLATVSGVGLGAMTFVLDRCTFSFLSAESCDPGPQWPHQALGIAMVGAAVWTWVSSARDAAHAAERANAHHNAENQRLKPILEPGNSTSGGVNAGLRFSF